MNLFLTEDGVLKMGYYGLTTQAECYSIRRTDCDGVRSFAPEVFEGEYDMKSDVLSLGVALLEMLGIVPYATYSKSRLLTVDPTTRIPFDELEIKSTDLVGFLNECFEDVYGRWNVNELLNVSVME